MKHGRMLFRSRKGVTGSCFFKGSTERAMPDSVVEARNVEAVKAAEEKKHTPTREDIMTNTNETIFIVKQVGSDELLFISPDQTEVNEFIVANKGTRDYKVPLRQDLRKGS